MARSLWTGILALVVAGCGSEAAVLEVDLTTQRLDAAQIAHWPQPAVESGQPEITVRQVFTAQGPCRELNAALMPRYPGEFLLRVEAEDRSPCTDPSPHIGYAAVLRGLPPGTHRLRVVHVGADGRTLTEAVLEHPIIVTAEPANPGRDR